SCPDDQNDEHTRFESRWTPSLADSTLESYLASSPNERTTQSKSGSHNCQRRFDGPGGDAAHTQAASAIHIDIEEEFQLSDNRPVRQRGAVHLLRLLVHEIGHLLGLGHS
uniref:Peptidase_M10 domain-containing protein n=1 Tax=Macrostomum lignano TaxID=282301 RepID=A0A1I8FNP0_9PLAT